jgi:hypothetical protein
MNLNQLTFNLSALILQEKNLVSDPNFKISTQAGVYLQAELTGDCRGACVMIASGEEVGRAGWVSASETHHGRCDAGRPMMGFASLNPS